MGTTGNKSTMKENNFISWANKSILKIFFNITIFLFTFGQLGRISFFNQQINGYLYEFGMFAILLLLVFKYKLKPIILICKNCRVFLFFITILLFSYVIDFFKFSLFENFIAFLYLLRLIFYLAFWRYCYYLMKIDKKNFWQLTNAFFVFSFLTFIISFIQYFLYPDLRNLFYLGWDPHLYRMFAVFFDTSLAAAVYGILFLFFYKNYKEFKNHKFYKILSQIFIPIFFICLILTFSRSAYLILLLVIILDFFSRKKYLFSFIFLILFFFIIYFLPKPFGEGVNLSRTFSIKARLNDYAGAFFIWKNSPFFGVGYNRIRFFKSGSLESHAASSFSSSYLIILVSSGILGVLLFFASLIKLYFLNKKGKIITLFIALLSFTDNILLHPFILFLFGLVFLITMVDKKR